MLRFPLFFELLLQGMTLTIKKPFHLTVEIGDIKGTMTAI